MALTLNTSHALYTNLVALICVEGGAFKDLKEPTRTFGTTVGSGGTFGSGTYGEHFAMTGGGFTANGVKFAPEIIWSSTSQSRSIFYAANSFGSGGAGNDVLYSGTSNPYCPEIAINDSGYIGIAIGSNNNTVGTTLIGTGAHSLCLTRPPGDNETGQINVYKDGSSTAAHSASGGFGNASVKLDTLGGYPGQGSCSSSLVYLAVFDKILSAAEMAELHNSLTGNNAFALVVTSSGTTLTGANAAQANGTSTGVVGVTVPTAGANTAQANNGGTGALAVAVTLVGSTSSQPNNTSTGSLTGGINLSGANSSQAIGSSTGTLVINVPLVTSNSAQYSFSSTGSLLGALTTLPLKNNTGALLASQSGITVHIYQLGGALVATKTGQSTDTSGIMTINEPSLVSGTTYRLVVVMANGAEGMDKVMAA